MSEFLSDEEQISRFKSWWGENGASLVIGVAVAVAVIVGWRFYDSANQASMEQGSKAYAEYKDAAQGERQALADKIKDEFAGTSYHAMVAMGQASDASEAGDLQGALTFLEEAMDAAGTTVLGDLARLRLAKVQFGLDRKEAALATLSAISNDGYRSWALESQGDIYFAMGDVEQAHSAYSGAAEALKEGDQRPLLSIKVENTAPFNGEYVEFTSELDQALEAAETSLAQDSDAEIAENE
ncbi:MAG: tetratricopeptide repeat protein [Gammaproteobacteria bacterium]|nr:tetratricopeptide repeat protein [Gammaproteobacteria bacterium]MBT5334107.1 tetratricopeptide repeat protein [Gammaproteobacteria bacterium]MBT5680698.1 tetratricopeptide repeat protein [Gammaproteobacteria bacterium]MBT6025271.1 tetratricopeptide repeat protein [Gammaproteobacteria bacterium]MBT6559306.1 tetratricopeptide repeat protein [Gammaproteobacteria bacterium]